MAEKGFGAKEINLIGSSGTPTIESPGNLNLNANNVAISTNVSIGGTLSVTGNVSVGGTLTYEDVTNIDSVGIVTARQGVRVNADSANPAGNSATNYISVGESQDLKIYHNGTQNYITAADGTLLIQADNIMLVSDDTAGRSLYQDNSNNRLELGFDGTAAAYVSSSNVQFAKPITASTDSQHDIGTNSVRFRNAYVDNYYGSGANLTGIAVTEAPVVDYTITGDSGSNYFFHGGGIDGTDGNPDLYLIRGQKYRFNNTTGNTHPFRFTSTGNSNAAYDKGVTGSETGIQFWTIPYDAPAKLFYVCTVHGGMVGNIYIRGASGQNTNVGVTTFTSNIVVQANPAEVRIQHSGNSSYSRLISDNQNALNIYTGGGPSLAMKIDSSGRVQIASNSPADRTQYNNLNGPGLLNINNNNPDGTVDFTQGIIFTDQGAGNTTWTHGGIVCTGSTGHNGNMCFGTDGDDTSNLTGISEKMRLTHNGRLGLGETDPDGMLHLKGGVPAIFLEDTDGTYGQSIIESSGDDLKIRCDAGNASSGTGSNIMFQIDAQTSMRLMQTGSGSLLGIGGTPETGLDVVTNTANQAMDITTASNNNYQGDTYGDITLVRRHSATKHSTFGYSASMLDLRVSNNSHEWSVGQILGHVDPVSMTNYAGGLSILVSRGGTQNPTGRRDKGEYPQAAALFTSKRILTFSNETAQGTMVMHLSKNSAAANVQSDMIAFDVGGGGRGKIVSAPNGSSSPQFSSYSDRRLKTNFRDYTGGYDRIKSIPVKLYDEVLNDQTKSVFGDNVKTNVIGWIADEVQSVFPDAVTGTKDQVATADDVAAGISTAIGDPVYQSLSEGSFFPDAIQAIQKLIQKVETLEAEVAALKSS